MFQYSIILLFLIVGGCVCNGVAVDHDDQVVAICLESDREALLDFKNGLEDADRNPGLSSWKGSNCCRWWGISCENGTGAVTHVDLHNPHPQTSEYLEFQDYTIFPDYADEGFDFSDRYGFWKLSGEIRPSLTKLKSLAYLDLSFNSFNGISIPNFLGSLQKLQYLNLSNAGFNGPIPPHLGNLSSLRSGLQGRIPLGLSDLPKLQFLRLGSNSLTASSSQLLNGRWEKIQILDLGFSGIQGEIPASIGNMTSLIYLDLLGNDVQGGIPSSVGKLCNLKFFRISDSNLNGTLPESLEESQNCVSKSPLASLRFLDLSNNRLSGSLPEWLGQLQNLIKLIFYNLFEGSIPLPVGDIRSLDLSNNQFSGSIPENISDSFPNLSFLSLARNQIEGEIPTSIGKMTYLLVIDLSSNNLTGTIPASIGNSSDLKALDLSKNGLSGDIPSTLGQLSHLQTLHLSENQLSGQIPSSFQNLSRLETLDLKSNRLTGRIPRWIGEGFEHLRILSLRSNGFFGELPSDNLSNLSSLQVLDLAKNHLNGAIPASFGDFKSMSQVQNRVQYLSYGTFDDGMYYEENMVVNMRGQSLPYTKTLSLVISLDLSGNNLSGELPAELTKLLGLVVLSLSGNHISGHIPVDISKLGQLLSLDLSSNKLFGPIPESLSTLSFLGYLNLSNNRFSGMIPYTGHMTTFEASSFAGNPRLCGLPLIVRCQGDGHDEDDGSNKVLVSESKDNLIDKWFYLSVGLGFAAGLLVPFLLMAARKTWSEAYFGLVDKVAETTSLLRHKRAKHMRSSGHLHRNLVTWAMGLSHRKSFFDDPGFTIVVGPRFYPLTHSATNVKHDALRAKERLHLFEATLLEEGCFDSVVDGCDGVFHTASPVTFTGNDPQAELIEPAVKGTLNVLRSCVKVPSLKRVVLTSSTASCLYTGKPLTPDVIVDETWFSDPVFCEKSELWYMLSKTLAEEAAWKFAKENGIDLVALNPAFVIGPLLQPTLHFTVGTILNHINEVKFPNKVYRYVDVRDVALAHIQAFEVPSASGRYCLVGHIVHLSEALNILRKLYPTLSIPEECEDDKPLVQGYQISNEKAKSFGINFVPLEVTLRDTVESFKENGCLDSDQKALVDRRNGLEDPENRFHHGNRETVVNAEV
ncbi:NAD(P)-binding domain containing protein [Parasponia andersonii]|uniref:NAD(P)-binding domain containing protein n=1 Tax=Parasponia andersonii TaxID=3476 RepID=A0A2P5DLV9_PARAD|nr:NAD(P)-binding domain containing protein [Parasponia andersonii]